jgi:hypothetical protein
MKTTLLFTFLLILQYSYGQKLLIGVVVDAERKQPVPGASIFLSNTSIGTTANEQGLFTLSIPQGKYDLIASSIGFETYSQTITSSDLPEKITIVLQTKAKELDAVIVEPFEKDGWEKWGNFFLENFIGTSGMAKDCKLQNKKAIKFRHSKKTNVLTAIALEPLLIENKALGYNIRYQLEEFTYNFKTHYLYYAGYPLFEPMMGGQVKKQRWVKARQNVYYGSMMHFMRSLYTNTIVQEDFEVYRLKKIPNAEKARVKEANSKRIRMASTTNITINSMANDSSAYYDRILAQSDFIDVAGNTKLTGDSIAYAVDNYTAGMDFNDYLLIIYKKGEAPKEYRQQFPKNSTAMMSQVTLINKRPIEIQANGNYYLPADLLSLGYWAWSEKIATMLPFDYKVKD